MAPARFGTATYNRWYARQYMGRKYRWDGAQYTALVAMWQRESSWRHKARNPSGKYLGIPQTSAAVVRGNGYTVAQYMASPEIQVEVGLRYIRARYGTPAKAWSFWRSHHWY
ncbi:MAG: hypothetical protein EPO13_11160 [Actinomycetota bacterium]|nr:MAG: hypothetical protein EPO13_11160 [Actinomycetota bacterium]